MAVRLEQRNKDLSCVHDALVQSFEAGLLESNADEIIYHLPDNFPFHSISQLCSMLKAELHVNCASAVPTDEQLIHLFVNPETVDERGFVRSHAKFMRSRDLDLYRESQAHLRLVGFVAFKGINCIPFQDAPEKYHVPWTVRTLGMQKGSIAA